MKSIENIKLRPAITVGLLIGFIIPAIIINWYNYNRQKIHITQELQNYHIQITNVVALGMQHPLWTMAPKDGVPLLKSVMADNRILKVTIQTDDTVFLEKNSGQPILSSSWSLRRPIVFEQQPIGYANVILDTRVMDQILRELRFSFIFSTLIQLFLGVSIIFYLLNLKIFKPIDRLLNQSKKLANKDLKTPFIWRGGDELGRLGRSFENTRQSLFRLFNNTEQMNAQLKKLNDELKEANELKDEFLANTSHELRTPLNGITGLTESLLDGIAGNINPDQRHNLDMILSSSKRLTNLVNDILDYSKLKKHALNLSIRPVDLYSLVDLIVRVLKSLTYLKPIQLINKIDPNIPLVKADENRLEQILHNLIGNALKFTEKGEVAIEAIPEKSEVIISVVDTGIGIEPGKFDEIFKSFHQGDNSIERAYSGSGLGLAITKRLVELHDGKIWLSSTPGKGSTFSFSLPVSNIDKNQYLYATGKKEKDESAQLHHQFKDTQPEIDPLKPVEVPKYPAVPKNFLDTKDITVLAVDDEPVNLQVLMNTLQNVGIKVETALSGFEALNKLNTITPDIIIMDIMMPKMNGYQTALQIREFLPTDEVPIIFLTAKKQIEDFMDGFSAGGNDYLTKPFSKIELLTRLNFHIKLAQSKQRLKQTEEKYRMIFENSPEGIFHLDARRHLTTANITMARILGYESVAELFDSHFSFQNNFFVYPSKLAEVEEYLQNDQSVKNYETLFFKKDHSMFFGSITLKEVCDKNGSLLRYEGQVSDCTSRKEKEKAENQRQIAEATTKMLTDSINYAKMIQGSLLPDIKQFQTAIPNSFFLWMPRDIVSGDIYFIKILPTGYLIALFDCTGHGVPGAFMSLISISSIKRIILDERIIEPAKILNRLNFNIKTMLNQHSNNCLSNDGLDAAVCFINPYQKTVTYAGANQPLVYLKDNELSYVKGDRQSIGYKKSDTSFSFTNHIIPIEEKTTFYLFSDGYKDQIGGINRRGFGQKKFFKLLQDIHHHRFDKQKEELIGAFEAYKKSNDQVDDITIIGFNL